MFNNLQIHNKDVFNIYLTENKTNNLTY